MKHILATAVFLATCAASQAHANDFHRAAPDACAAPDGNGYVRMLDDFLRDHPDFSGRILIRRCGTTVVDQTHGSADSSAGTAISQQTIFDIGSLTKQLTAAAILRLRDKGLIALDDRMDRWFDGLPEATAAITIHELLTHSAGLPLYSGEDYDPRSRQSFEEWLSGVKLDHPPGQSYQYSNPGYSVLALLVERISGVSYDTFLQREFFNPLSIEQMGYMHPTGPLAVQYDTAGNAMGTPRDAPWDRDGPYWNLRGNGGALANPQDLLRWTEALRSGEVLSQASTQAMFSALQPTDREGISYGYGWQITENDKGGMFAHGGSNGVSFYTHVRYLPATDTTLVFAMNRFDVDIIRSLLGAFSKVAEPAGPSANE